MSDDEDDDIEDELPNFSKDPKLYECWTMTTLRGRCPKCKEVNYIDLGDLNDYTAPDQEVCVCWNCGTKSWIIDPSEAECYGRGADATIDDFYDVKGTKEP